MATLMDGRDRRALKSRSTANSFVGIIGNDRCLFTNALVPLHFVERT